MPPRVLSNRHSSLTGPFHQRALGIFHVPGADVVWCEDKSEPDAGGALPGCPEASNVTWQMGPLALYCMCLCTSQT